MAKITDLFMDDIELILEKIPQGSAITVIKEELESDENLFILETEDLNLLDEIEMILHAVEKEEDDDEYIEEEFDSEEAIGNISFDDDYGEDE
ncbi:MAG: hypothetical protein K8S23_09930 [Candidatus Cloacimonetes bacterium]|nr:hypothetical protein [Candidatus Cloacimonadota bacterium]